MFADKLQQITAKTFEESHLVLGSDANCVQNA